MEDNSNSKRLLTSHSLGTLWTSKFAEFRAPPKEFVANKLISTILQNCSYEALKLALLGGSPSLVFMGEDSCPEGCGFESQHHILDVHFCCKNCNVCLKRRKEAKKRPGMTHF